MNELFLVAITLTAALIYGNDRAPALAYCLVAHVFNLAVWMTNNPAVAFIMGCVSDVLVIILLVCLSGCLRSRITYYLIPLSILSIVMHFYGWSIYQSGASYDFFNSLVVFYMCVVIALFVSRAGRHGNNTRHIRFLRGDNDSSKNLAMVSK